MANPQMIDPEVTNRLYAQLGMAPPEPQGVPSATNDVSGDQGVAEQPALPEGVRRRLMSQVHYDRLIIGGDDARMAMYPQEFADKPEDLPNVWERGARGIAMGFSSMIPASLTLAGGILEFAGLDEAGTDVAQAGLSVDQWLQENVAVENPTFYDHLMMGVGSMASFLLPGLGAASAAGRGAQALGLAGRAAKAFQAVTGAGAMGFLEAGVEQAQRQQELMAQGQTPSEAMANSEGVFWQNMILLTATNAPFFSPAGRVARAALSTLTEGGQERFQSVIQDVASGRGEWSDFFDPSKYRTETAVGAIVGGGAGLVLPGEGGTNEAPSDNQDATTGNQEVPPSTPEPEASATDVGGASEQILGGPEDKMTAAQRIVAEVAGDQAAAGLTDDQVNALLPVIEEANGMATFDEAAAHVRKAITAMQSAEAPVEAATDQSVQDAAPVVSTPEPVMEQGERSTATDGEAVAMTPAPAQIDDAATAIPDGSVDGDTTVDEQANLQTTEEVDAVAAPSPGNPPNHVVMFAVGMDERQLGEMKEPHDGTLEGMSAANQRLRDRAAAEFGPGWSNSGSVTIATDESGKGVYRISPNGRILESASEEIDLDPDVIGDMAVDEPTDARAPKESKFIADPVARSDFLGEAVLEVINDKIKNKKRGGPVKASRPKTKQHKIAAALANKLGLSVVFYEPSTSTPTSLKGIAFSTEFGGAIGLNTKAKRPLLMVAGHEAMHVLERENPALWSEVHEVVRKHADPGAYEAFRQSALANRYNREDISAEFVAEAAETAFGKQSFWDELADRSPEAFGALVRQMRRIISQVMSIVRNNEYGIESYFNDFAPVEKKMAEAFARMSRSAVMRSMSEADNTEGINVISESVEPRTPEMKAKIEQMREKEKAVRHAKLKVKSWRDVPRWLYKKFVDRNTYVYTKARDVLKARGLDIADYDASKRPDRVLQMMGAWTEQAENALKRAVMSWDNRTVLSAGLETIIRKYGLAESVDSGEFGQFVIAARLRSMHDTIGDDFFGSDPASPEYAAAEAEYLKYQDIYSQYDALEPEWKNAVKEISEWSNALMLRLYQSGALSKEQYDGLVGKYDVYAPLFVLDEEAAAGPGNTSRPKPTAGRVTYAMDRLVPGLVRMDPMEGLIKNAYRIEFLANNNHAKMTAAKFIEDIAGTDADGNQLTDVPGFGRRIPRNTRPVTKKVDELLAAAGLKAADRKALEAAGAVDLETVAKLWVADSFMEDGVVAIMRDGKVEYWELEPDIYDAYAAVSQTTSHDLMKFFTIQTRLLRAGAVLTPEFMARNQFRDFLAAGVLSRHMVKNPVDAALLPVRIVRGLAHAIKKDDVWRDFMMDRAGHSALVALDQENLRKHVEDLNRSAGGVSYALKQFARNPAKYIVHSHPLALLQAFSKLTENSTRIAVYEKARADLMGQGVPEAEARVQAALDSREASTDFGRAGEYGRVINQMIPFFNASIQGNDKMMRALLRDKGSRGATWLRGALMITAPSVALWALNHDEDWYKEQPLWLKNHFWLFSLDGGKTIHKIPKPFEVGLVFGSLPERFLDWAANEDPEAMKSWADALRKNLLIVDPSEIAGPIVASANDIRSNYDTFRDTPIVKGWLQDLEPRAQYNASTSEFAKWLGDNYPGRGLSPLMIDYFVKSSFGGVGSWGMEIASNMLMMADPKIKDKRPSSRLVYDTVPDWMPIIRAVTITTPQKYTRQMDEFYKAYDRSQEAVNTLRSYTAGGANKQQYIDLYRRSGVDIALHEALVRGAAQIGMVSRQIRTVESAPDSLFDSGEKRKKLDELMEHRNKMIDAYMTRFNEIDRDEIQRQVDATVSRLEREYDQSKGR